MLRDLGDVPADATDAVLLALGWPQGAGAPNSQASTWYVMGPALG
jgi:hypothetical protein